MQRCRRFRSRLPSAHDHTSRPPRGPQPRPTPNCRTLRNQVSLDQTHVAKRRGDGRMGAKEQEDEAMEAAFKMKKAVAQLKEIMGANMTRVVDIFARWDKDVRSRRRVSLHLVPLVLHNVTCRHIPLHTDTYRYSSTAPSQWMSCDAPLRRSRCR